MFQFPVMPPQASEWAFHYDMLFWATSALTVFFTLVVGILVTVLAIKYRAGSKADRRNPIDHSTILEMAWSIPPLILAVGMFFWSAIDFVQYRKMPTKSSEIFVIGKQWMWHLQHMNGIRENNELHCVVGQPIKMTMISQDVIHAMYLPDFRAQYHVVPGRYTELTFTPTMTGKFKMLCAMHCGTQHSEMVGQVIVMNAKDYADWLAKGGNRFQPTTLSMADAGKRLFTEKGCGNCHGAEDTERAPSLTGLFGRQREFDNGEKVVADNEYVRESIVNPWRLINKGYTNTMPAYRGQITEEQVLDLMAYIKSISGSPTGAPSEAAGRKVEGTRPGFAGPQSTADAANRIESAGAAQFKQSENRP